MPSTRAPLLLLCAQAAEEEAGGKLVKIHSKKDWDALLAQGA